MNKQDFGTLIAELRQEHVLSGKVWTREILGEKSGLGKNVIDNIERGEKAHIEPETLYALCEVLQLSSLERKELFIAASGIDAHKIFEDEPIEYYIALERILAKSQLPAFIIDPYGDVIALNPIILKFYQVTKDDLENSSLVSKYNIMRILFSPEFSMQRQLMGNSWHPFALRTIHTFRAVSLRYRAKPYFKKLVQEMASEYPKFASYWQGSSLWKDEFKPFSDNVSFSYKLLNFTFEIASSTITSVTSSGELILFMFTPLSSEASWVFRELSRIVGTGAIRLAQWPEKP